MNKQTDLILHCGASKVDLADVENVPTPAGTDTWTPIPHSALIDRVESTLVADGLRVVNQAHSLTRNGARYFGLMQVANGHEDQDHAWVLGLRNAHDKMFQAGMVVGSSVFVCDNLSFSGEIRFQRKHTRHILRDLPALVGESIGKLMTKWHEMSKRIEAYKNSDVSESSAHDLIVRAMDVKAITPTQLPHVLAEWREPKHSAFSPRTAWSLFNGFTEVLKECSLAELPKRTTRLHGLFDTHVGLNGLN